MNNKSKELLSKLQNILQIRKLETSHDEKAILNTYFGLLEEIVKNYSSYREISPNFLSLLEDRDAIPISIKCFFSLYDALLTFDHPRKFSLSKYHESPSDQVLEKLLASMKFFLKTNTPIQIYSPTFSLNEFSDSELIEVVSSLLDYPRMNEIAKPIDKGTGELWFIFLAILKAALIRLNDNEIFYFMANIFLKRLNTSEFFQQARDVAESCVIASFDEKLSALGFLSSFECYANQCSVSAALLYGNLSIYAALQDPQQISDKFLREIVSISIRFFRDAKLHSFVEQIYNGIPPYLNFQGYERRSIDHSFFLSSMIKMDPMLPKRISSYLRREIEIILKGGEIEAIPWIVSLSNIKRLYGDDVFQQANLNSFDKKLRQVVKPGAVDRFEYIISGDLQNCKKMLFESINKLSDTRDSSDIVYDISHAVTIASRMLQACVQEKDPEGIILAMQVKADFSLTFVNKASESFRPLNFSTPEINNSNFFHFVFSSLNCHPAMKNNAKLLWLGSSEKRAFGMTLQREEFYFFEMKDYSWDFLTELNHQDGMANLISSLGDSCSDVLWSSPDPKKLNGLSIEATEKLSCFRLSQLTDMKELLVIKDMDFAAFPHNLLIDSKNQLISDFCPITNVLTTDWLIRTTEEATIPKSFSRTIWIPTESGDFTINLLFSRIEKFLMDKKFSIEQTTILKTPISSDLIIACSHGGHDIAEKQVVFTGDVAILDFDKIVEKGMILILFICHSGSYKKELFRNTVTSLVKAMHSKGFETVIAPFWPLHVDVPEHWLPEFITSMESGMPISQSAHLANLKVKEKMNSPSAWCCLHTYGNPSVRAKERL